MHCSKIHISTCRFFRSTFPHCCLRQIGHYFLPIYQFSLRPSLLAEGRSNLPVRWKAGTEEPRLFIVHWNALEGEGCTDMAISLRTALLIERSSWATSSNLWARIKQSCALTSWKASSMPDIHNTLAIVFRMPVGARKPDAEWKREVKPAKHLLLPVGIISMYFCRVFFYFILAGILMPWGSGNCY